jgi:hypothetical protein
MKLSLFTDWLGAYATSPNSSAVEAPNVYIITKRLQIVAKVKNCFVL